MAAERPITDGLLGMRNYHYFIIFMMGCPWIVVVVSGIQLGDDGDKRKKR